MDMPLSLIPHKRRSRSPPPTDPIFDSACGPLAPVPQDEPSNDRESFVRATFFAARPHRERPAKSRKGLCRAPILCDVIPGQMAKVELKTEF
jgi:hypothetical protein